MQYKAEQDHDGTWGVIDERGYRVCDLEDHQDMKFIAGIVAYSCTEVDRMATARERQET